MISQSRGGAQIKMFNHFLPCDIGRRESQAKLEGAKLKRLANIKTCAGKMRASTCEKAEEELSAPTAAPRASFCLGTSALLSSSGLGRSAEIWQGHVRLSKQGLDTSLL